MRDEKRMKQKREKMSRQWYGGILSYATTSLFTDSQTEKRMEN
jgi:hypothetical protein